MQRVRHLKGQITDMEVVMRWTCCFFDSHGQQAETSVKKDVMTRLALEIPNDSHPDSVSFLHRALYSCASVANRW